MDRIREFIDLALALTGAAPGVTGAIVSLLALIPAAEVQEWDEAKVRAYVMEFRARQDAILEEFNKRRKEIEEDE